MTKTIYQQQSRTYKLIIFDVDGTLQDSNHILQPFTRRILMALKDHGIHISFATGKNLSAIRELSTDLEINIPMILANGCVLQDRFGEVFYTAHLPIEVIQHVIDICDQTSSELAFYIHNDIYVKHNTHNLSLLVEYGADPLIEIGDWSAISGIMPATHKCLVVDRHSQQHLVELEAVIKRELGDAANLCQSIPEMMDIMPVGISKATGIKTLADHLGIDLGDVITFGDSHNDIEMVKAAGLGAAVANSVPELLASADVVVGSNDEEGPAHYLRTLFKDVLNLG